MRKLIYFLAILLLASCTELRIDPDCYPKNDIIHTADDWEGRVYFSSELDAWMIRHYVPGTIDSFYTGAVCNLPAEFKEDDLEVVFSGYFKDDKGKIRPSTVIGGEEFYFLEIVDIALKG